MRLIGTLKNEEMARRFSLFLKEKGIENECETSMVTDWGSPEYGDRLCRIWVVDEDRFNEAEAYYADFQAHPQAIDSIHSSPFSNPAFPSRKKQREQPPATPWQSQASAPVTLLLILLCALLFFWDMTSSRKEETLPVPTPLAIVSPINKALLYDYPAAYQKLDQLIHLASQENWKSDSPISAEGQVLLEEFTQTPYWHGLYDALVSYFRGEDWQQILKAPRFEKIKEGEVWRLFTPALLHGDLLHLLFNMLWLIMLGRLMEVKLGVGRYLLFCLFVGVFSNTAQYLMSGTNFIGFSGILCGMITFIWMRQHKAPWEGYLLQKGTFGFLALFVIAMFVLQVFSFAAEIFWGQGLYSMIANTSHLSGALAGYLLAQTPFFAVRS